VHALYISDEVRGHLWEAEGRSDCRPVRSPPNKNMGVCIPHWATNQMPFTARDPTYMPLGYLK
jgi:hypothetical protein